MRRSFLVALVATLGALTLLMALAVAAPMGSSQTVPIFNVNDTTDAPDATPDGICASTHFGFCTLRAAIQEAECGFSPADQKCTFGGGGIVNLPPPTGSGNFDLTIQAGNEGPTGPTRTWSATGDLDISTDIRVNGVSPADSVIDGQGHRIFDVHDACCLPLPLEHGRGSLTLTNLTLQNGAGDPDPESGHEHGGAIHNHGYIDLFDVLVTNSRSPALGGWGGGGITNASSGEAQLSNVTVAGNRTEHRGGGIENLGELRMLGVTIAENTAPSGGGGGIYLGLRTNGTASRMGAAATLVAKNMPGGDCAMAGGTVTSAGFNLAGDGSCSFTHATDRSGDPGFDTSGFVGPLFYPLQATSRAVDRGFVCQNHDIRGVSRPQDGNLDGVARCDAGSYEREATAPLTCNGVAATIYVDAQGRIVGGPGNGHHYGGRLIGTSGADVMVGTTGRDRFVALKGNDLVCGGEKGDLLEGGPGNDTMTGDAGADRFDGGSGKDTATDFIPGEGDTKTGVP